MRAIRGICGFRSGKSFLANDLMKCHRLSRGTAVKSWSVLMPRMFQDFFELISLASLLALIAAVA